MDENPLSTPSPTRLHAKINTPVSGVPIFGCEHLQRILSQGQESLNMCVNNYKAILRRIYDDVAPIVAQTAKNPEGQIVTTLTSTYLCLQCPDIVTIDAIPQHGAKKAHRFYVNSRSGTLYCHMCDDYIYDPTLEELQMLKIGTGSFTKRKRKADELPPEAAKEESHFIGSHTAAVSCRANGLRGLYNAGATCYQNVVLQTFLHNPLLRNYYLSDRHSECNANYCLSCAIDDIFQEFYATESTNSYTPANVLSAFWFSDKKAFENLVTTKEQDAHEFFQFLAEELHERNSVDVQSEGARGDMCGCIIHQVFYGTMVTTTTCQKCLGTTDAVQTFLDLSLGLESLAQRKKKGDGIRPLTLLDCLDAEFIKSDKCEYRCQNCKSMQSAKRQGSIKRLPNTLSIQLKRFEYRMARNDVSAVKIDTPVEFPLELNMLPYTTRGRNKDARFNRQYNRACTYDLQSIVVHTGDTETGHYTTYNRVGDQWFKFNDHQVRLAMKSEVLGSQAYLLFYVVRNLSS